MKKFPDFHAFRTLALAIFSLLLSSALQCLAVPTDTLISYWQFENETDDQAVAGAVVDNGSWIGSSS